MNRSDELRQREYSLRTTVQERLDRTGGLEDTDQLEDRVLAELAEMQMLLERHLAEKASDQRDIERYYLEFQLPVFTYLRRWYHFSVLLREQDATPPPPSLTT